MLHRTGLILLFFLFYSLTGHAANEVIDNKDLSAQLKLEVEKSKSPHKFELSMGATSFVSKETLFFSSRGASEQLSNLNLNYKYNKNTKVSKSYIDVSTLISFEEEFAYPNMSEFYYTRKFKNSEVTVGRKKQNWFKQDLLWDQGLWQPRFAWDRLKPETQGLLAAFYQHDFGKWNVTGFYSPIFIPEIPPGFKIEEGSFVSANPWFKAPMSSIDFVEVPGETPIYFELSEIDYLNDLVSKQTLGAHVGYENGPYSLSLGYAYKPMNQVLMEFPFELNIGGSDDKVNIYIHPKVVHHHLTGLEGQYKATNWSSRLSVNVEVPEKDTTPEDWVSPGLGQATIASAYFDYNLFGSLSGSKVYSSLMKVWGGDVADNGPQMILNGKKFFERRYNYTEAVMLGVKHSFTKLFKNKVNVKSEVIYDIPQNGAIFSSAVETKLSKKLGVKLSVDFLGLTSEEPAEITDGFIGNFRANDRIMGELSYVF